MLKYELLNEIHTYKFLATVYLNVFLMCSCMFSRFMDNITARSRYFISTFHCHTSVDVSYDFLFHLSGNLWLSRLIEYVKFPGENPTGTLCSLFAPLIRAERVICWITFTNCKYYTWFTLVLKDQYFRLHYFLVAYCQYSKFDGN